MKKKTISIIVILWITAFGVKKVVNYYEQLNKREALQSVFDAKIKQVYKIPQKESAFINSFGKIINPVKLFEKKEISEKNILKTAVKTYTNEKENVFGNEEMFVVEYLKQGSNILYYISSFLMLENEDFLQLKNGEYYKETPQVLLERMAAIDFLDEVLLSTDVKNSDKETVKKILRAIIEKPIDEYLPEHQKRVLFVEKTEALTSYISTNRDEGIKYYQNLKESHVKRLLRLAALNGIYASGVGNENMSHWADVLDGKADVF